MGAEYDRGGGESAGGGASGGYISDIVFTVTAGETITFVVGQGGAAGGGNGYNSYASDGNTTSASRFNSRFIIYINRWTRWFRHRRKCSRSALRSNSPSQAGTATVPGTRRTSGTFVETTGVTTNVTALNGGPVGTFNQSGAGAAGTNPGNCGSDNCQISGGVGGDSYAGNIAGGTAGTAVALQVEMEQRLQVAEAVALNM